MIAVIIPDRGDRPEFMEHCLWLIDQQTIKPNIIEIVNDPPLSEDKDVTWRYRLGLIKVFARGADMAFLWENDDWYGPNYIERMLYGWTKAGKPSLFGIGHTYYYHLKQKRYRILKHSGRASAMNTIITKDHPVTFPPHNDPFFDLHIWKTGGKTFLPNEIISLGIKHGIGLCGGKAHEMNFKYDKEDNGFLQRTVDPKSYEFYQKIGA